MTEHNDQKFNPENHYDTSEVINLKLKELKGDLRLMILGSVALNQFLSQVALPKTVSAAAIAAAVLVPLGKSALAFLRA